MPARQPDRSASNGPISLSTIAFTNFRIFFTLRYSYSIQPHERMPPSAVTLASHVRDRLESVLVEVLVHVEEIVDAIVDAAGKDLVVRKRR